MIDAAMVAFFGGEISLTVATVDADGQPYATRGWSLLPVSSERARLLIDANDASRFAPGVAVAMTAAEVRTFRAVQLKGRCRGVDGATDADRAAVTAATDRFATAVRETDGTPRHLFDRLVPAAFVACLVDVDEAYDQTPGPGAGAPVAASP